MSTLDDVRRQAARLSVASHKRGLTCLEEGKRTAAKENVAADLAAWTDFMNTTNTLETEIDDLRADAERFRWMAKNATHLVDGLQSKHSQVITVVVRLERMFVRLLETGRLDLPASLRGQLIEDNAKGYLSAAIDSAMKEQSNG